WTSDDGDGNQTWANFGDEIEITSGLNTGNYNLKILYTITGSGNPGIVQNGPFTATFNIVGPSAMNSEYQILPINVYPNPFNEFINIQSTEKINIKIFDFTGKLVIETQLNGNDKIYLNQLISGIYYLRVENKNINLKIIKL
ncbi:MAG: T9SS type A sorting domain-containing protein, partial [Bacteroidales bacterium]